MTVKALKKQLMAAIAMVVVSAIALSSSTYAWFAANNSVIANMASIKAKSDAAFLQISKTAEQEAATSVSFVTDPTKELFPARVKTFSSTPVFESGFAQSPSASTLKDGTLFDIDSEDANAPAHDFANYIWHEKVYIAAQSGTFKDLTVSAGGVVITATDNTKGDLVSPSRILFVCKDGENTYYQLWSNGTLAGQNAGVTVQNSDYLYRSDFTVGTNVVVDMYFYYDGDVSQVYTNNLNKLGDVSAEVSFTATQVG